MAAEVNLLVNAPSRTLNVLKLRLVDFDSHATPYRYRTGTDDGVMRVLRCIRPGLQEVITSAIAYSKFHVLLMENSFLRSSDDYMCTVQRHA